MPDFADLDEIITRHRDEQIAFLRALVRARSANPFIPDTSDPSEPIERAVAYLIHDKLREIGLEPELNGESMERSNVIATLGGTGQRDRDYTHLCPRGNRFFGYDQHVIVPQCRLGIS
jgi:acetylornithine deacetylase/succinyl-diaminopimelate desuccinylase-like protein